MFSSIHISTGFSGKAQWSFIRELKSNLKIPVIGNGDVFKPEDAIRMQRETGCDGIMIGRGAIGNPWIFRQIIDILMGDNPNAPTLNDRKRFILDHFDAISRHLGKKRAKYAMRRLLLWYTKGLPFSNRFRASFFTIKDKMTLERVLDEYFKSISGIINKALT